jgi:hypothetical protein
VSDLHSEKHDEPRISTLREITIDRSDDDENALDSICVNREGDSNEIHRNCSILSNPPMLTIKIDSGIHAREGDSDSRAHRVRASTKPSHTTKRR